jgi:hypothetical protein
MPTHRLALLCALTSLVLFSCNNKKTNNNISSFTASITRSDTIQVQADEPLDIGACNTGFIADATQHFTAPVNKIAVIIAKRGLKLTVNPAVLEKEDGSPVNGKINISIIELTNSDDLFKSNAATVSNGRLLSSGGSYYIGMECNGQQLRIKNGKTLQVNFPVLRKEEMELFYGERDADNNMNWRSAGMPLQQQFEEISFTDSNRYNSNDMMPRTYFEIKEYQRYQSLNDEVYYYTRKMTLRQLIDTLNRERVKVYIDSIYNWPRSAVPNTKQDTNFLRAQYGPRYLLSIRTARSIMEEKDEMEKNRKLRDSAFKKWEPTSIAGQIQKYYAPSGILQLGWVNCDWYYKFREKTDVNLDIPITLNNSRIEYFLIYKTFNGLVNKKIDFNQDTRVVLRDLPVGESIMLIAFAKNNGIIFQGKESFVVEKDKRVPVDFKVISKEELRKIFRNNVRA